MAKINMLAVRAHLRGLLTICSSRMGAYLRGKDFSRGTNSRTYGMLHFIKEYFSRQRDNLEIPEEIFDRSSLFLLQSIQSVGLLMNMG